MKYPSVDTSVLETKAAANANRIKNWLKARQDTIVYSSLIIAGLGMTAFSYQEEKKQKVALIQSSYEKGYHEAYTQGYGDASAMFKQWLLDIDYAEYDRKTGEWKICDPTTIQGELIEPRKKAAMVNMNDYALALQDELSMVQKQRDNLKKKQTMLKPDFSKLTF